MRAPPAPILPEVPRGWATWKEVRRWALISLGISILMLGGVTLAGYLLPADPDAAATSRLLVAALDQAHSPLALIAVIFIANFLVLCLHYCCCLIGAIVSRPFRPLPEPWASNPIARALHRPVPGWLAEFSLYYAAAVTLGSIALQSTELGFVLADISSLTGLPPWEWIVLMLPHALLELPAIFLPLGLFLLQARRRDLKPLQRRAHQAFAVGVLVLLIAAVVEVEITPHLVSWWLGR